MSATATMNGTQLSGAEAASLVGIVLAFLGVFILLVIAFYVLVVIAYWKMFTKAGEKGWKAIIPIYNVYVAFRIAWNDKSAFWIFLLSYVVFAIAQGTMTTTINGVTTTASFTDNPIAGIISLIAGIVALVWTIRFYIKQAHAYSKGTGCGVLTLFFPNIMTLFYGFASSAVYKGPQD